MSDRVQLVAPRVDVVMTDGAEFTVQTDNRDLLGFERLRSKHKWPSPSDAPFGWLTFLAWHALKREGQHTMTLPEFEAAAVLVTSSEEAPDAVDPTQPEAEPDY